MVEKGAGDEDVIESSVRSVRRKREGVVGWGGVERDRA